MAKFRILPSQVVFTVEEPVRPTNANGQKQPACEGENQQPFFRGLLGIPTQLVCGRMRMMMLQSDRGSFDFLLYSVADCSFDFVEDLIRNYFTALSHVRCCTRCCLDRLFHNIDDFLLPFVGHLGFDFGFGHLSEKCVFFLTFLNKNFD